MLLTQLVRAGAREKTEKGKELLVAVGLGDPMVTVTLTAPAARSAVGTVPDRVVLEATPVGERAVDPNMIVPPVSPLPFTVSVN